MGESFRVPKCQAGNSCHQFCVLYFLEFKLPSFESQSTSNMASKRKADEVSSKKTASKPTANGPPPKKQRKDEPADIKQSNNSKPAATPAPKPAPVSLIQEEERSFPRGGGGLLTSLEHKQIQIQATKDALFEESGLKRNRDDAGSDDGGREDEVGDEGEAAPVKAVKKKSKKSKTKPSAADDAVEKRIRTDGLKFKRLTPGSLILGQISKISTNELILDLPNNLAGHVSIANVSPTLNERLMALGKEDGGIDIDGDEEADIDLERMFYIGQYLRACVLSTTGDPAEHTTKSKKRIELSLDPRHTNPKIEASNIKVNSTLQASVASVEDHGLIMHTGLEDDTIKGFMSSKEIPSNIEYSRIKEGAVFLCLVTGLSSNGKVIKLSANHERVGDLRKGNLLADSLTVNSLLPGTAVELLVSQVSPSSIAGHLMGTVDAGADIVHCGAASRKDDIESKYKDGDRVKTRILFSLNETDTTVIGLTLLDHVLSLRPRSLPEGKAKIDPLSKFPIGTIIDKAKVINVESGLGIFTYIGAKDGTAFVHVSRMSEGRVDPPSQTTGPYRSGTSHRARIIGYNFVDGMYLASLEQSVIDQKYLRIEDVPVGELVQGTVEKLIVQKTGSTGVIVNIAKGISGLVPEMHLADIHLQHPERKFKEGLAVTARVLSTDAERHQIRLTLKKSIVNSDAKLWTSYDDIGIGSECPGTVLTLDGKGALMQFFGNVRGFLPVSQMADTYVEDAKTRFRIGQVITTRAVTVNAAEERMSLSCRSQDATDLSTGSSEITNLRLGQICSGVVSEKAAETITIDLKKPSLKATLPVVHLTDGSSKKNESALKQIRVGQKVRDLVIVEIFAKRQAVTISNKPSLVKAAQDGNILSSLDDLDEGMTVSGFVRNVTEEGIFLQTVGGLTGFIHRSQVSADKSQLPDYGVAKGSSLSARVVSIDLQQQRFSLSLKPAEDVKPKATPEAPRTPLAHALINPVDGTSKTLDDLAIGNVTTAKVSSVKDSQLNVQLADNVQGRIDVSEVFNKWEDIKDRKHPLRFIKAHDQLQVRILGIHDARNHRFLPISHRGGKVPMFELSAKTQADGSLLSYDQLAPDSWHVAFVNNTTDAALWVNLSPNVRGRIERMDVSQDVSVMSDLASSFPIGSAIRVRVKSVDAANARLDLSAKPASTEPALTLDSLSEGSIVTGRVTKATERAILVQLGPTLVGQVGLTDLADDFDEAKPTKYQKNDVVRACVTAIDRANKKLHLSTRPSKVLSSSLPVKDHQILETVDVKTGDFVRGFVKNVTDKGVFVALSHSVTAFVPVPELSDKFVKDWKALFEVDRLVNGKVIARDAVTNNIKISLKESVISGNYVPIMDFNDFQKDQIVTGKVRKVEVFGAFIVIDNTRNVSGLAHRSQIAERRVEDARTLLEEGDAVKAKILKIDASKQQISLGLKRSYFDDGPEDEEESEEEDTEGGAVFVENDGSESDDEVEAALDDDLEDEGGVELDVNGVGEADSDVEDSKLTQTINMPVDSDGLDAGTFDWSGTLKPSSSLAINSVAPSPHPASTNHKAPTYQEDQTLALDTTTTPSDYERNLLTTPNSASLWISYMQHHITLGSIDAARALAERALTSIHIREQDEKLAVWLAFLGLEIEYSDDESVDSVFARACEYSDAREVHLRAADAFAGSGRIKKADETYNALLKHKDWNADIALWLSYARFLFDGANEPERARALLQRADQVVVGAAAKGSKEMQARLRRDLLMQFAMLEFKCENGDPEQGRTQFEKLVDLYPRRWDLWDVYLDMERHVAHAANASGGRALNLDDGTGTGTTTVNVNAEAKAETQQRIRDLYERMTDPRFKMKKRRAAFVFKRWLEWEEKEAGGERKRVEHVKARAADVAERLRGEKDAE